MQSIIWNRSNIFRSLRWVAVTPARQILRRVTTDNYPSTIFCWKLSLQLFIWLEIILPIHYSYRILLGICKLQTTNFYLVVSAAFWFVSKLVCTRDSLSSEWLEIYDVVSKTFIWLKSSSLEPVESIELVSSSFYYLFKYSIVYAFLIE